MGVFVRFVLADGELVEVRDHDTGAVYDELWNRRSQVGSVSTAGMLNYEVQLPQVARHAIDLTEEQGDALCDAMLRQGVASRR